jgi:predicted Fe-Mo cluster-binding NifX family protein
MQSYGIEVYYTNEIDERKAINLFRQGKLISK